MRLTLLQPRDLQISKLSWELNQDEEVEVLGPLWAPFLYERRLSFELAESVSEPDGFHSFFGVGLTLEMRPPEDRLLPVKLLECSARGLFSIPAVIDPSEFDHRYIDSSQQLLYGFIRGVIFASTSGLPGGPLVIPSVDLVDIGPPEEPVASFIERVRESLRKVRQQLTEAEIQEGKPKRKSLGRAKLPVKNR